MPIHRPFEGTSGDPEANLPRPDAPDPSLPRQTDEPDLPPAAPKGSDVTGGRSRTTPAPPPPGVPPTPPERGWGGAALTDLPPASGPDRGKEESARLVPTSRPGSSCRCRASQVGADAPLPLRTAPPPPRLGDDALLPLATPLKPRPHQLPPSDWPQVIRSRLRALDALLLAEGLPLSADRAARAARRRWLLAASPAAEQPLLQNGERESFLRKDVP